ncbi:MAG: WYL domain-containing protein [Prevotellaceae bacterium]|jgi:predicted DNA-binding transcriptional regulator YafY|nr:WYL domain-containing protein [Prevotellaceae bacterium]
MSKLETIKRQYLIIEKIKRAKFASFEEISDYLERESQLQGYNLNISRRTFLRDLDDIGSLYGIYIKCNRSNNLYFIEEDYEPEINGRMLEAFNMFHTLKIRERQAPYLHMEKQQSQGIEHIYGLLHAIKNRLQITFHYQKYYRDTPDERTVESLALKEFKNRWYLFAKDIHDGRIKCYALDRLSGLKILTANFSADEYFDINSHLKYCYGVSMSADEKPSEVILSFDSFQGKYIKSLPLHHTQEIIEDSNAELRIRLKVYLTLDFVMELLSYGDTLKVIAPARLIDELKAIHTKALEKL